MTLRDEQVSRFADRGAASKFEVDWEALAATAEQAGVDVDSLDGTSEVLYAFDHASPNASPDELYARLSDLIRQVETSVPIDLAEIPLLRASPIESIPVLQLAGEATALQYRDFRNAVRSNPAIAADKFKRRALLACCINSSADADDGIARTVALVDARPSEQPRDVTYWATKLGAFSLISTGELMVNDLPTPPKIHFTLVGEDYACLQERHEPGEAKRQWLLQDRSLVKALADTAVPQICSATFIDSLTIRRALTDAVSPEQADEVREALESGNELPQKPTHELLVQTGIVDGGSGRLEPQAAKAWLEAIDNPSQRSA